MKDIYDTTTPVSIPVAVSPIFLELGTRNAADPLAEAQNEQVLGVTAVLGLSVLPFCTLIRSRTTSRPT